MTIAQETLSDRAHAMLRSDIVSGRLAPETRLRIVQLSEAYGIGASPLREALSKLTSEFLVLFEPQRGFSVAPVSAEELRDISRVRCDLESEALRRAINSAGLTPDDLDAVLLVGGSSRIPLVSQMVSAELGRSIAVDADPKAVVASGAALAARGPLEPVTVALLDELPETPRSSSTPRPRTRWTSPRGGAGAPSWWLRRSPWPPP